MKICFGTILTCGPCVELYAKHRIFCILSEDILLWLLSDTNSINFITLNAFFTKLYISVCFFGVWNCKNSGSKLYSNAIDTAILFKKVMSTIENVHALFNMLNITNKGEFVLVSPS